MRRSIGVLLLVTAWPCCFSQWKGSHRAGIPPAPAVEWEILADFHARARMRFERATFYKPKSSSNPAPESALAPLIVQQWPIETGAGEGKSNSSAAGASADSFGRVHAAGEDRWVVDPSDPVVYVSSGVTRFGSKEHGQITYLWFYPFAGQDATGLASLNWRGVQLTLDDQGFPVIAEILANDSDVRVFFVAASLEASARAAIGGPLLGRRFAVERPPEEARNCVVAAVMEDGPVPMGPYVYLAAQSREVTTLLCRCSPSQVDEFAASYSYALEGAEALPEPIRILERCSPRSLEEALRLPPS